MHPLSRVRYSHENCAELSILARMNEEIQPPPVCAHCGSPEATAFDDLFICDACYIASGSCCAGDDSF
jgi:hypothetical protein